MSSCRFGRLAVALLAASFAVPSGLAQQKKKSDQDPNEKPRNVKPELKKAYKDWLDKDVAYIITDEERKRSKNSRRRRANGSLRYSAATIDPDTDENSIAKSASPMPAFRVRHFRMIDRGRIYIQ
jgi:hypothetical protein